jgi:hypothetical protein
MITPENISETLKEIFRERKSRQKIEIALIEIDAPGSDWAPPLRTTFPYHNNDNNATVQDFYLRFYLKELYKQLCSEYDRKGRNDIEELEGAVWVYFSQPEVKQHDGDITLSVHVKIEKRDFPPVSWGPA